ncbi:MAG: hypothetical protein Q9165_001075 [Trypethelium subeluteriae]
MRDVEELINDHIANQQAGTAERSKLKLLVPPVGTFFTPLMLQDAFTYQDSRRFISSRCFVPPSFNDIRLILNTAQVMSLVRGGPIELMTFDGDVTLYDDGESLAPESAVIRRILMLMSKGIKIGIVTAAGYLEARKYYSRLHGLLDAIHASQLLPPELKKNIVVMGGESNYLFRYSGSSPDRLIPVQRHEWLLDDMKLWSEEDIIELLDIAESALTGSIETMRLDAQIVRKERGVGMVPSPGQRFAREQLEETVLLAQKILARLACTTAWIASPTETVALLDEISELDQLMELKRK